MSVRGLMARSLNGGGNEEREREREKESAYMMRSREGEVIQKLNSLTILWLL